MTVREYIGARYIPLYMGDWDDTKSYEPLSIVNYQGDSYTSMQYVPAGIAITNTSYWAQTGNYNSQIEAYREETQAVADALPISDFDSEHTVDGRFDSIESILPLNAFDSTNTIKKAIDNSNLARIYNQYNGYYGLWIGDSFVIANSLHSDTTRFSRQVCDYFGLTELNYAVGGGGFAAGTTFATQLATAIADLSYDKEKVRYVFICGGQNDATDNDNTEYTVSGATVYGWLSTLDNLITTNYPNAEIVFIPMTASSTTLSANQMWLYQMLLYNLQDVIAASHNNKYRIIKKAYLWLNGRYSFILNSDKIHPNQKGHDYIASQIIANMLGYESNPKTVECPLTLSNSLTYGSTSKNVAKVIVDDNNQLWLHLNFIIESDLAFGTTLGGFTGTPEYDVKDVYFTHMGEYRLPCNVMKTVSSTKECISGELQIAFFNNRPTLSPSFSIELLYAGAPISHGTGNIEINCRLPIDELGHATSRYHN